MKFDILAWPSLAFKEAKERMHMRRVLKVLPLRTVLAALVVACLLALGSVGCGSGDLPATPDTSVASAPTSVPISVVRWNNWRVTNPSLPINPSLRAPVSGTLNQPPVPKANPEQVHAMSNGTLRACMGVNNDTTGYAWPSAYQVAHILVDGTEWRVDNPSIYESSACVDISLLPGPHTVSLVEDYWATHDLVGNSFANLTISSGQLVVQGADFDDKECAPSCP
jgi:hypothetical protein